MILAGDIGGTNTRLSLVELRHGRLTIGQRRDTCNKGRSGLVEIIREFLDPRVHSVQIACFGVAGPVADGRATMTNLRWTFDEQRLRRVPKISRVLLINDLVAHAEGTNVLRPKDVVTLVKGKAVRGETARSSLPARGWAKAGWCSIGIRMTIGHSPPRAGIPILLHATIVKSR